jgi:hypothetical protein
LFGSRCTDLSYNLDAQIRLSENRPFDGDVLAHPIKRNDETAGRR